MLLLIQLITLSLQVVFQYQHKVLIDIIVTPDTPNYYTTNSNDFLENLIN